MAYVDDHLLPNERIVYRAHLHWRMFFWPLLLIIVGLLFPRDFGIVALFMGIAWSIPKVIEYRASEFAVTNKRVMIKRGILRRSTFELSLDRVEIVRLNQRASERLLDAGSVSIRGTGGTWRTTPKIANPSGFAKRLQIQMAH